MAQRVLVILGHPSNQSLCAALAQAYASGARSAGMEVRTLTLADLAFDPLLRAHYGAGQVLEPALVQAQEAIRWADHLAWVYPTWWAGMPALLKGFVDRVFLPGFAFKYRANSPIWDRLLAGRSAELLVTMDSPPWYFRWVTRQPGHHQMKKGILEFSGIAPVRVNSFGPVIRSTPAQREAWLAQAHRRGVASAAVRPGKPPVL